MIGKFHPCPTSASLRPCIFSALLLAYFSASAWPQTQLANVFGTTTDPTGAVITESRVAVSFHRKHWIEAFYTFAHSVDDASSNVSIEAVNEPPDGSGPLQSQGGPRPVGIRYSA